MKKRRAVVYLIIGMILNLNLSAFSMASDLKQNNHKNKTSIVLQNDLNNLTVKKGETFCGYSTSDTANLIPPQSLVCSQVIKSSKAGRLSRNGIIKLKLTKISTPDGKVVDLSSKNITYKIKPISNKKFTRDVLPAGVTSIGVLLPLAIATNICGIGTAGISIGAGALVGATSAIFLPDPNKTKAKTAIDRAIYATPIGLIKVIVSKGQNIDLKKDQNVMLKLKRSQIKAMNAISNENT